MNSRPRGFTLVEILIVIAIIAVFAAILFPVFNRVREKGRFSVCQSNLKQIALGVQQYVQDYDGVYPADRHENSWYEVTAPYIRNPHLLYCPSQSYSLAYNYNGARLNSSRSLLPLAKDAVGKHEAALQKPAHIVMLEDSVDSITPKNSATVQAPQRIVDVPTSCHLVSLQGPSIAYSASTVHSDGGNYAFVDGHVKWLTPEKKVEVECAAGSYLSP